MSEPATPSAQSRKPAKPLSWMTIVWVILGALAVCVIGWFQSDIRAIFKARAWDTKTPIAVAERFATALNQGDRATLEQVSPKIILEEEGGKIVRIKPAGASPQMAPYAADAAKAKVPLQISEKRFDLRGPSFIVAADGETSKTIQFVLTRDSGTWTVQNMIVLK